MHERVINMTTLNITAKSTVTEEIEQIRAERDLQISLIEEKYDLIDQKFETIYGRRWRKVLDLAKNNRLDKDSEEVIKALEINKKIKDKVNIIHETANKKINIIKEEEKRRKLEDLDNLINDICK